MLRRQGKCACPRFGSAAETAGTDGAETYVKAALGRACYSFGIGCFHDKPRPD